MHLPRDSPLMSALADDPAYAGPSVPRPPKLAEFSYETEALASIHDLLASLLAVVMAFASMKPPQVKPYPRPVTAQAEAGRAADRKAHNDLMKRVLPGRG
jgi:hypothetical protein